MAASQRLNQTRSPGCYKFFIFLMYVCTTYLHAHREHPDFGNKSKLQADLLDLYKTEVNPVSMNGPVTVRIGLELYTLLQTKDYSEVINMFSRLVMEWTDERLKWNPKNYGNIDTFIIEQDRLWIPRLNMMNADSLLPSNSAYDEDPRWFPVIVHSNGTVRLAFIGAFLGICSLRMDNFPIDWQTCTFTVDAAPYHSDEIQLDRFNHSIDLSHFERNLEWGIDRTEMTRSSHMLTGNHSTLEISVHLQRQSMYFFLLVCLPCVFIMFVTLLTFWIPLESKKCLRPNFEILFTDAFFLFVILKEVPHVSSSTPALLVSLPVFLILTCVATVFRIICSYVYFRSERRPVSRWLRAFSFGGLAKFCGYEVVHSLSRHRRSNDSLKPIDLALGEWKVIAFLLNELFVFIYLLLFSVSWFSLLIFYINKSS